MYKNQLQELAQRSCFNLPSYSCIREGPDHAPRFKVTVNFNGETFESPTFCSTLRQAEHAAAEVALNTLANGGPSRALAARVLDETGVYKNLLQETAHRAGLNLPIYTNVRSGPGHVPTFKCTVEIAGLSFSGEPAKTKKQAQKNAAMAAWSTLKQLAHCDSSSSTSPTSPSDTEGSDEQDQVVIARLLASKQSTEVKIFPQQRQEGPTISIHNFRDPIRQASNLYPVQYETWAYSGYLTEMAMYRGVWQQAQSPYLQNRCLLAPSPQVRPVMPPFLHSDHIYYTIGDHVHVRPGPTGNFSPPLAPAPAPAPIRGGLSMVKIQELHDEKTDGSRSEVVNSGYKTTKEVVLVQETVEENDKQRSGISDLKLGGSGQQEKSQTGNFKWVPAETVESGFKRPDKLGQSGQHEKSQTNNFEWVPAKSIESGFNPTETRACESSSQSNHRPTSQTTSEPPLYNASPVRIRNVGPTLSLMGVRPQNLVNGMPAPRKMKSGVSPSSYRPRTGFVLPSRFMAPAVQIRSVVPVCSAPPTRKLPEVVQEGNSSSQEGNGEQDNTGIASSKLSKLRI